MEALGELPPLDRQAGLGAGAALPQSPAALPTWHLPSSAPAAPGKGHSVSWPVRDFLSQPHLGGQAGLPGLSAVSHS